MCITGTVLLDVGSAVVVVVLVVDVLAPVTAKHGPYDQPLCGYPVWICCASTTS